LVVLALVVLGQVVLAQAVGPVLAQDSH